MDDNILPGDLTMALDERHGVTILSLDCFDTLLWRDTHAPSDLFAALAGPNLQQRVWAERRARSSAMVRHRRLEVGIADIYAQLLPNATPEERAAMVTCELTAEADHCFAFVPTVALMRAARDKGLRIIVISDTYLNAVQLGDLIAKAAGDDVRAMIDQIFCSSEFGVAKRDGLIGKVVKYLDVRPDTILHIGDNHAADLVAGQAAGVHALHLKQFTSATEQRLRLEASTSAIIHVGDVPNLNSQLHRAAIAIGEPAINDPAERLGFTTIGPLLHGFAKWVGREAHALRATSKGHVHTLFLMRDGYLPRLVFDAMELDGPTHATEISRFTATAASFATEADVLRYLDREAGTLFHVILAQLLFEPQEIAVILRALAGENSHGALVRAIRAELRMKRVLARSRSFAERLIGYLQATIAPAPGDTLMLVDLGYNGSVQNEIEPVLRRMLDVTIAGRYLLLREHDMSGFDKTGFIGPNGYDANTRDALSGNVSVLEQLCTAAHGSVIDYTPEGSPVRAASAIKGRQSLVRDAIQRGALQFARVADRAIKCSVERAVRPQDLVAERASAAAVLARLMFLPMAEELAVLEQFQHDVNLGIDATVPLFDRDIAQRGLRERGLFYMRGADRMYLPAELHGEGLAVKMMLLTNRRFGLPLKNVDFTDQTISLPILIADGRTVDTATITATPTHDGYFLAPIPISDCRFSIGLQFGQLYEWLQVESTVFMPVDRFLSEHQRAGLEHVAAIPTLEGMEQTTAKLFRCDDAAAFMMIPPPPRQGDRAMMLAVVFRPIAPRASILSPPAPQPQISLILETVR